MKVLRYALDGHVHWSEQADGVPPPGARLLPPIEDHLPYLMLHGNCATIWKRQMPVSQRWQLPRVPFVRYRPHTARIGHEEALRFPAGPAVSYGAELGIVIAKDAREVPEDEALDYVLGFTCLNDMYGTDAFVGSPWRHLPHATGYDIYTAGAQGARNILALHAEASQCKAVDGAGGIGPWIVTRDEVGDEFDLLMHTSVDGRLEDRAHTSAYLMRTSYVVSYLSQRMTLPKGAVISLGAAGWDGLSLGPGAPGGRRAMQMAIEKVGELRNYIETPDVEEAFGDSPFMAAQKERGLRPASGGEVWMLWENHSPRPDAWEGVCGGCAAAMPYPRSCLGTSGDTVQLPPSTKRVSISVQVAVRVGGEPVNRPPRAEIGRFVDGLAVAISVRDESLLDDMDSPTCYEQRAARFLGGVGDGFQTVGQFAPLGDYQLADLHGRTVQLAVDGASVRRHTSDSLLLGPCEALLHISRGVTLLPGDVIFLGGIGEAITVEVGRQPKRIEATIAGIGGVQVTLTR